MATEVSSSGSSTYEDLPLTPPLPQHVLDEWDEELSPLPTLPPLPSGSGSSSSSSSSSSSKGSKGSKSSSRSSSKGSSSTPPAPSANPPLPPPTNLAPLLDMRLSATHGMRAARAEQLRKFNLCSELHACVTFDAPQDFARATAPYLTYFGLVLEDKTCAVTPAARQKSLYLRGFPPGLTHSAVSVLLGEALAPAGFALPPLVFSPPAALAHPAPAAASAAEGGAAAALPQPSRAVNSPPCAVTNGLGEVILTFDTFQEALCAHDALLGFRVGARSGARGAAGGVVGGKLAQAQAQAQAQGQAQGRAWGNGELIVGLASPSDLKRCGAKLGASLWGGDEGGRSPTGASSLLPSGAVQEEAAAAEASEDEEEDGEEGGV